MLAALQMCVLAARAHGLAVLDGVHLDIADISGFEAACRQGRDLGFDGKSLGDPAPEKWGVKKDSGIFDQFAGATITPRAVVKAVKGGLEFYADHRQEILGGQS